jgi:hypothetical protein
MTDSPLKDFIGLEEGTDLVEVAVINSGWVDTEEAQ